jgi:G:T-mismatch repair DNA endonuclease (very short patch repair protein)
MTGVNNPCKGQTKESIEKTKQTIMSRYPLGRPTLSEDQKKKRSIDYRGNGNPFFGKHHTPETITKIKASSVYLYGKDHPNFGRVNSEYTRQRSREANLGSKNPNYGGMTDEHRQKILQSLKNLPNKPEKEIIKIIEDNGFPFKYVGNGKVFIARKNPDFINYTKTRQIIEMCGVYYHTKEEMDERVKLFAKYGFSTLVIWDSELKDKKAVELRIKEFTAKGEERNA